MDAANLSPFKLMVTIVDRSKAEQVIEVCCDLSLPYHVAILGEGTATGEILDYFGLASTDKAVVLSLVCSSSLSAVRAALRNELQLQRKGYGILFTIPISAISKKIACALSENTQNSAGEVKQMEANQYDLILAIVNQGYSDQAMDAAKEAGAGGGTLLHARKIGSDHEDEFFGISIKQEKDVVAILTPADRKNEIMKALLHAVGASTPAEGTVLALPVDAVEGLRE